MDSRPVPPSNRPAGAGPSLAGLTCWLLLLGYALAATLPLLWVASTSLKADAAVFEAPFALPEAADLRWDNYARAWTEGQLGTYLRNSVVVTVVAVAGIVGLGAMAAHALARFRFGGSETLFLLLLAGLMVPAQLTVIPLFFLLRGLGLLNTLPGLILVYIAHGLPFATFVLTSFFRHLPGALHEAARVDGATEWQVFTRVFLPLALPGLATVTIFQFISVWREYFFAFMLLSGGAGSEWHTLPLGLANLAIRATYQSQWGMTFAGIVLTIGPMLLLYLLLQKQLLAGLTAGAVKG